MMSGEGAEVTNRAGVTWHRDWLGNEPGLYRPEAWQPASRIRLARFRQIYLWPLTLRLAGLSQQEASPNDTSSIIEKQVEQAQALIETRKEWAEIRDLLDHAPPPDATRIGGSPEYEAAADTVQRYAEFVYFHDFVQSVLYGSGEEAGGRGKLPFRVYRRTDIEGGNIHVVIDTRIFEPRVERCNLYVFRTGAAVLVVELDFGLEPAVTDTGRQHPTPLRLSDALDFTDKVRRSYTPYYSVDPGDEPRPGGVADVFSWRPLTAPAKEQERGQDALSRDLGKIRSLDTAGLRSAPMAGHWREMLSPLEVAGYESPGTANPVWRHVVDERIPVMSYISLTGAATALDDAEGRHPPASAERDPRDDLRLVSRGDWMRVCEADSSGDEPLPYAPGFMHEFEKRACYDRYFPSEANRFNALRYMFTGYHFSAVGSGDFFDHTLVHHFRRHYFQMALLLHMDYASLLAMSSRISEAVRQLHQASSEPESLQSVAEAQRTFRSTISDIERDFLELVHQFHFTGLSNQLQAREMFEQWRVSLGLNDLFNDLKDEIESATQFLYSREQIRQAEDANKLSTIAAIAVLFGLAFAVLGMNVLVGESSIRTYLGIDQNTPAWLAFLRQLLPFGVVILAIPCLLRLLRKQLAPSREVEQRILDPVRRWTRGIGIIAIALGFFGLVL